MANSADPDQLASEEANWSGSTLFAKAGYIRVQQDKGWCVYEQQRPWIACRLVSLIRAFTAYGEKAGVSTDKKWRHFLKLEDNKIKFVPAKINAIAVFVYVFEASFCLVSLLLLSDDTKVIFPYVKKTLSLFCQ